MPKSRADDRIKAPAARERLDALWLEVGERAEQEPGLVFLNDAALCKSIKSSVNHAQVAYRFCLPVQLLGKLLDPQIDCLALQRGTQGDASRGWDARSLASKVIAPFNIAQENVLGTSGDPYVGNAMRIPRMLRDDPSKKDVAGWNTLLDVLEAVEKADDPAYTEAAMKQTLVEFHHRQRGLRFSYPVPPRASLETVLDLARRFVAHKSGGDRAQAVAGALFDVIGLRFGLYASVRRARINASDEASGQAADLECLDADGKVVMAVEVKDRALKLADIEGAIIKTRQREIRDLLFAAPRVEPSEAAAIESRIASTFAAGQNLYVADTMDLARSVLALGGESSRTSFLKLIGEHLDLWNTQPSHRQAWKGLLETI